MSKLESLYNASFNREVIMSDLSSVAKGDAFEAKVFKLLKSHILAGEYTLNPKKCQFFMQKGYFSYKRKKEIKVDMSIEVHAEDKEKLSLLVVVECKNYNKRVGVDDIEEFESKLSQISGKNVKGIVFTTKGFQSGALEFASSIGIALARFLPDNQIQWFLERTPEILGGRSRRKAQIEEVKKALTDEKYEGKAEFIFSAFNGSYSSSFAEIFNKLIPDDFKSYNQQHLKSSNKEIVPYIGQSYIDGRVNNILKYFGFKVKNKNEILLSPICDYLSKFSNVEFIYDEDLGENVHGNKILGKLSIDSKAIFISNTLELNSPRWRFTLAHELGHFLLHRKLLLSKPNSYLVDSENSISWENIEKSDNSRLEWQANSFASSLLLPKATLIPFIANLLI
ncbi:ImmA/IrrE family metallo-endopeptidase [Colwellia sp. Arc7-635]|nr:ImmA/IrrE family metallo-endopeptidase [Colwellia sp. Arc7-635]